MKERIENSQGKAVQEKPKIELVTSNRSEQPCQPRLCLPNNPPSRSTGGLGKRA